MRALFLIACYFLSGFFAQAEMGKPNILFIAVDDMKPLLGCYGDTKAITPNIDKLAGRGTLFSNAHCQWAVCGPSRVSLMTSLMPEETGVLGFKPMRAKLPDVLTLPTYLAEQGYVTTGIGKIFDHRTVDAKYDERSWTIPFTKIKKTKQQKGKKRPASVFEFPLEEHNDYKVMVGGLRLLRDLAAQDKPFFLGVGFHKPHLPLVAPQKYWDMYDRSEFEIHPFQEPAKGSYEGTYKKPDEMKGYTGIPQNELPEAIQLETIHGYYACVSFIDDLVGDVLTELETLGLADNTIICFWGDHGFHLGDHGLWAKHSNIEQAARVPMIFSVPGMSPNEVSSPAAFLDVFPTLCDVVGLETPDQCQGVSLLPAMKDPSLKLRTGVITMKGKTCYAYRTERYRYIEWIGRDGDVRERNLYDYLNDPMETVNIANDPQHKQLLETLAAAMREEGTGCHLLLGSN